MKLSTSAFILVLVRSAFAAAFTIPFHVRCKSFAVRTQAEEHLERMPQKWNELKKKEEELEWNKDDSEAFMDFALETLETAIEHVHTKEEVEEEHVTSLHKTLKKVLETEHLLEAAVLGAHHVAEDADDIVNAYATGGYGEDREKRRELTTADLAHHIEDYADERLHQVKDKELHVREEEEETKKEITHLKWNEEVLNYALEALKALKHETEEETNVQKK